MIFWYDENDFNGLDEEVFIDYATVKNGSVPIMTTYRGFGSIVHQMYEYMPYKNKQNEYTEEQAQEQFNRNYVKQNDATQDTCYDFMQTNYQDYLLDQLRNEFKITDKHFWIDEWNVCESGYTQLHRESPWRGTQLGVCATAIMEFGIENSILWTLYSQQWRNNTQSSGEFTDGIQMCGLALGLNFSTVPTTQYYAFALLSKFLSTTDTVYTVEYDELYSLMKKACDTYNTGYNIDFYKPYVIWLPLDGYAVVQLVHIRNKNGTDPFELSEAELEGGDRVYETFNFFKKYIPEFKDSDLIMTAPQIGVRETRHTCKSGIPYEIPLRALLPKGIDGLLTVGRCISGDFYSHASYRVTGNCVAMGEGAAIAVAKALRENIDIREVKSIF